MSDHRDARAATGARGESLAARFLRRHGYTILHRNLRLRCGEIDIVATRPGELRFVEVRTVKSNYLTSPAEAVSPKKRRQVARVAQAYINTRRPGDVHISCDVIGVRLRSRFRSEIVWIRDAFGADGE